MPSDRVVVVLLDPDVVVDVVDDDVAWVVEVDDVEPIVLVELELLDVELEVLELVELDVLDDVATAVDEVVDPAASVIVVEVLDELDVELDDEDDVEDEELDELAEEVDEVDGVVVDAACEVEVVVELVVVVDGGGAGWQQRPSLLKSIATSYPTKCPRRLFAWPRFSLPSIEHASTAKSPFRPKPILPRSVMNERSPQ